MRASFMRHLAADARVALLLMRLPLKHLCSYESPQDTQCFTKMDGWNCFLGLSLASYLEQIDSYVHIFPRVGERKQLNSICASRLLNEFL